MPELKDSQYLLLLWVLRERPEGWFTSSDMPLSYGPSTVDALVRHQYLERSVRDARARTMYRLTGLGREKARELDGHNRSDVKQEREGS